LTASAFYDGIETGPHVWKRIEDCRVYSRLDLQWNSDRQEIKGDRVVFVGHSMGAGVIWPYSVRYPMHVNALVPRTGDRPICPLLKKRFSKGARYSITRGPGHSVELTQCHPSAGRRLSLRADTRDGPPCSSPVPTRCATSSSKLNSVSRGSR